MKKIFIYFGIVFVLFFLFSGCSSEPDCSEFDTPEFRYDYNSQTGACEPTAITPLNLCGDSPCPVRPIGDFATTGCYEETCVLFEHDRIVTQTRDITFRNSDLIFNGEFTIRSPYVLNAIDNPGVSIKLSLFNTLGSNVNIKDIVVHDIVIRNRGDIRFASINLNQGMNSIGNTFETNVDLLEIPNERSQEDLNAVLSVSYTIERFDHSGELVGEEKKRETLTAGLGRWEIINPKFHPDYNLN